MAVYHDMSVVFNHIASSVWHVPSTVVLRCTKSTSMSLNVKILVGHIKVKSLQGCCGVNECRWARKALGLGLTGGRILESF